MASRKLISNTDSVNNRNGLSFVPRILTHHKSLAVLSPIISLFDFGAVNPTQGGTDYGQSEVCEANASQETGEHGQDGRPGFGRGASNVAITTEREGEFVTCERVVANRRRVISLARLAFGLLRRSVHRYQPIATDPIRHHSFSGFIPLSVKPSHNLPPLNAAASLSLESHLIQLTCNLAGVKFGAIWDISGKRFVLFQDPITKTSLALPLDNNFAVQAVRSHLRASREKFGVCEDL